MTTKQSHAASFSSASATLTTSRPSASSPLTSVAAVNDSVVNIFDNKSRFLASDSAKIVRAAGTSNTGLNVASQSADLLKVFLTNSISTLAGAGADILVAPITALHQISFTPNTPIPSGGKIIVTYPGTFSNIASPSATTFSFNNLVNSNVKCFPTNACSGSITISSSGAPTITLVTGAIQSAGTVITVFVGCSALTGAVCTTQAPTLINPTKSNTTAAGADIWRIGIASTDASNNPLDSSNIAIGTIDSVTVRATIDPSLTFSIAGIASGAVNTGNATGCSQGENVNTGIASTATDVSLGALALAPAVNTQLANVAAQLLTVTTNGSNGYSITATSSGHLAQPSTGFFLNDSFTPTVFPASGHFFGLHACGIDADYLSTKWTSTTSNTNCNTYVSGSAGNVCKYGWPTQTNAIVIAQDSSGPVGNSLLAGNGLTSISYAATQDVTLPPGIYQSVVTYVATPSF